MAILFRRCPLSSGRRMLRTIDRVSLVTIRLKV
jgi:hypothetical protein